MRLWRLMKVTKTTQSHRKNGAKIVIETVAGIVVFKLAEPYATKEQLLVYRGVMHWVGYLTGSEGKDVTDRLPQERWEELYSQAQAILAMTGDITKMPLQEII